MTELQIWQSIAGIALFLLVATLLLLFVAIRSGAGIRYRHLSGSERIYLYGDGITPGWYRLERRAEP